MRWGNHDAVGVAAGVGQDRVGDGWGWGVAPGGVDTHWHFVGNEHLERGNHRRLRQGVGVTADVDRTGDTFAAAVIDDRLRRRQDMRFVECII